MLLFYVRHGDPIYDPDSLTPLGQAQAQAMKKRLGVHGLDKIYCSSSNRAILTAKPTADLLKIEPEIFDWANEGHAWNQLTVINAENKRPWCYIEPEYVRLFATPEIRSLGRKWYEHPKFENTTFGEGICRVQKHADEFLASLGYVHDHEKNGYVAQKHNNERVAFFAHEGFGFAFLSCIMDIPYPEFSTRFQFNHSGLTIIEFAEPYEDGFVIPHILQHSSDAHIFAEGLPLKYQNRIYL